MKKILLIALTMLGIGSTLLVEKASAAPVWQTLSEGSSSGTTLQSGYYWVTKDITFTNGAAGSGLSIADGAIVHIYVPKGVTLTAKGGNGDGQKGGGAGIYLPSSSTLYLKGNGKVVA